MAEGTDWFVYLARCADGSLYTGIAKNVEERLAAHNAGRGARYTRGRGPLAVELTAGPMAHGDALRLERAVKRARADQKRAVLAGER